MKITFRKLKKIKKIAKKDYLSRGYNVKTEYYTGGQTYLPFEYLKYLGKTVEVSFQSDSWCQFSGFSVAPWMCKGGKF